MGQTQHTHQLAHKQNQKSLIDYQTVSNTVGTLVQFQYLIDWK